MKNEKSFFLKEYYGMPIWLLATSIVIIAGATFGGFLAEDEMFSSIAIMFAMGVVLFEIGEHLPIWKDYIGGGAVMAFFGAAVLNYYHLLPEKYDKSITFFYDGFGFLTIFISLLIVSSILNVNRRQLLKAFLGYIPAILGGIFMSAVLGIGAAKICGIDVIEVLTVYALPIMGGGTGAGAVPLSEMWQATTGQSKEVFYSKAFAILNVANNFAILGAVALNTLGEKYPNLTGNGELLKNPEKYSLKEDSMEKPKIDMYDMAGGLMVVAAVYAIGSILKKVVPPIGSVTLHMYVWMVIFTAILNIANIIPIKIKEGSKFLANFLTKPLMCMCMFGIGVAFTELGDFIAVLNVKTLFICFMIVLGAIIGAGVVGVLFGFNFVESAMTAGLCMANRGGAGDLQVLGAGKRYGLMSYAQISSRIGGAIILFIASVLFALIS